MRTMICFKSANLASSFTFLRAGQAAIATEMQLFGHAMYLAARPFAPTCGTRLKNLSDLMELTPNEMSRGKQGSATPLFPERR